MSPKDFIKVCPRCGTAAELEAPFCVNCGRRYRTEFTHSPDTHSLLVCPPVLPAPHEPSLIGTTVLLHSHRNKTLAARRVVSGIRFFGQRVSFWRKFLFGRPTQREKEQVTSRLSKV